MSPLDDELRAALQGRARAVSPSPDPLLGIERRARRMRRNKVAASVAGSALAVAAVAGAVPLLSTTSASGPAPQASPEVVLSPSPTAEPVPFYALDPASPWAYRGDPAVLEDGFPETVAREVAARRGVDETAVELTPLFGQVYEPSAQPELVWLADVDGELSWGVAQASEAGPELVWDAELPAEPLALAAALPGDEVARLLVVASPDTGQAQYGPDAASEYADLAELAPGVHTGPLEGDAVTDSYRVLDEAGEVVVRDDAPDAPRAELPEEEPAISAEPANLLDWPSRGTELDPELEAELLDRFAGALEADRDAVRYRPLFTGDTDGGVRFTLGQAWVEGSPAHVVTLQTGSQDGTQVRVGPVNAPDEKVVAEILSSQPGTSVDTLVVVPVPGTGQVLYDDEDSGDFRPVGEGQDYLDGVVLVDLPDTGVTGRLRLLDGNGDVDRPLFDGLVVGLLCGFRDCG